MVGKRLLLTWLPMLESEENFLLFKSMPNTLCFRQEMRVIKETFFYKSLNFNFFYVASKFVLLAILIPFVLLGQKLTAETAFFTISLYNTVRTSVAKFVPLAISAMSESYVSLKRIQAR